MYVITGITGQIGGAIGRALLKARQPVRAVVRDVVKGQAWADQGCALALATIEDQVPGFPSAIHVLALTHSRRKVVQR